MKIKETAGITRLDKVSNPYSDIAKALIRSHIKEIYVDSEGAFPPLSEEALAEKIQHEWGKQPGKVEVRIADNARSPERYLVRVALE